MKSLRPQLVSLLFGSFVLLAACLEPTQIELSLRTDVPFVAGRSVAISVSKNGITDNTAPSTIAEGPWGADGAIGTLVVLPSESRDEAVSVRAVLGLGRDPSTCTLTDAKGCIFARRRLAFVPHEPLALPVTLYAACEGVPCDEGSTCTALGACVSADLDATACADGKVCEPGTGEASRPDGAPQSSSGSSGVAEASSSSGGASSSGGGSGTLPACDPTDVTVESRDFFSFGNVNTSGDVTVGDQLTTIALTTDGQVATFERTLQTPNAACPLHFVMDLADLDILNPSTNVTLFSLKRDGITFAVTVDRNATGVYTVRVMSSTNGLSTVSYAWPAPRTGPVEMILAMQEGPEPALRVVIGGIETSFDDLPKPVAPVGTVSLQFGLSGARSSVGYRTARYFFGP